MPFNVKLREARNSIKLRDGKGLSAPVRVLSHTEFVLFENCPDPAIAEDPNLIIEEVIAPVKKKRRKKKPTSNNTVVKIPVAAGEI